MARSFEGQVVWITGGGTGIGKACAVEFARQGASVAVSGRRADRLDDAVAEVEAAGGKGLAVVADVTEPESLAGAVAEIVAEFGRLDVCVANAGFAVGGRFQKLTLADWQRQFDINVMGLVATVQAALPEVTKQKGRLALVGSVASFLVPKGLGCYSASKFAVRAIGEMLSNDCGKDGVSCTTIFPGYVESELAKVDNQGRFDASRELKPNSMKWTAEDAARVMVRAIHKRKRDFVFTGHGKAAVLLARHTPALARKVAG